MGHSFGALVCYELANALSKAGRPPEILVVIACATPHSIASIYPKNWLVDDIIINTLQKVGMVPSQIQFITNQPLLYEPLRADFLALQHYKPSTITNPPELSCSIVAVCGSEDPLVSEQEMEHWSRYTSDASRFRFHRLIDRDHFLELTKHKKVKSNLDNNNDYDSYTANDAMREEVFDQTSILKPPLLPVFDILFQL